jgi:CDP-diglyceride synthetase
MMIQHSINYGIREFFREKDRSINLGLSMILWGLTIYCYQINDYYDYYFPGDQFEALISLSTLELIAYVIADFVYEQFKTKPNKKLFYYSYTICIVGAIILISNDPKKHPYIDLAGEFICKFGIASAY